MVIPLKVDALQKDYGNMRAVDGVSFEIAPGEVFGLLGPNGAGKTSIISTITTLQKPTAGAIEVFGVDVVKEPRKAKEFVGFVPQELIHHGFFTVEEILRFHANFYGIKVDEAYLKHLLEKLQLEPQKNKLVNQLSGGMKRRLLILKALLHRPKLLLLDEPTAGVDIELRAAIWQFVQELKEENISILLTTHYLEEAERLSDRVGIIDQGKIKRIDATKKLLLEHSSKRVTFVLTEPISEITHPHLLAQSDHHLDFQIPNEMPLSQVMGEAKLSFEYVQDVNIKVGTLEDVMLNILKQ